MAEPNTVAENVCEHGDHPAPAGQRFCSSACQACESVEAENADCAGICFWTGSVHELKTWPVPYEAVATKRKWHEVRRNDRDFRVGDLLYLREWDALHPGGGRYTGRASWRSVSYITPGGEWGLPPDLCVMSLEVWEPVIHACSVEFPEVLSESIDNLCGALGVMAEQLEGDLERINCVRCLRMIAEAGERRGQEACGLAFDVGRTRHEEVHEALEVWVIEMEAHLATGIHPPSDEFQRRAVRLMQLRLARHRHLLTITRGGPRLHRAGDPPHPSDAASPDSGPGADPL